MLGLPTPAEQLDPGGPAGQPDQSAVRRLMLLQTARAMLDEAGAAVIPNAAALRESLEIRIKGELDVERRYADLSRRLVRASSREAARARVTGVEKVLARIDDEDLKLGRRRPDVVAALRATVAADLEAARILRLRRDQWLLRQELSRTTSAWSGRSYRAWSRRAARSRPFGGQGSRLRPLCLRLSSLPPSRRRATSTRASARTAS